MKRSLAVLALAALSASFVPTGGALAQDDLTVAAEHSRLNAERAKAEADYKAQEKACYGKFAVNDCLDAAKAKRRRILSDLRRQEVSLNDTERKRKAAERQHSLEERNLEQARKQEAQVRDSAAAEKERQTHAAEKAATHDAQATAAPGKAASREDQVRRKQAEKAAADRSRSAEAAKSAKEHEQRMAEAEERRQKQAKRLAERKKPPAEPLPVPP